ncbi:MAG TPA: hypothetical protein VGV57_11970 [Thermoleophilaceae bacterium]|nr:hypothetical protein [Thermoleophilaceae bacterium]
MRLSSHELIVRTQPVTPAQVNDLLEYNEVVDDDAETTAARVQMLEAQTIDGDDADLERWAAEHADRFVARLKKEWA